MKAYASLSHSVPKEEWSNIQNKPILFGLAGGIDLVLVALFAPGFSFFLW